MNSIETAINGHLDKVIGPEERTIDTSADQTHWIPQTELERQLTSEPVFFVEPKGAPVVDPPLSAAARINSDLAADNERLKNAMRGAIADLKQGKDWTPMKRLERVLSGGTTEAFIAVSEVLPLLKLAAGYLKTFTDPTDGEATKALAAFHAVHPGVL